VRFSKLMILAATAAVPALAWAGGAPAPVTAPALGDAGLIALGAGLLGAGVAFLRKH